MNIEHNSNNINSNNIMLTCTRRIRDDGKEVLVIKRRKKEPKESHDKLDKDGCYDDASVSVKLVPALELKQEGQFFVTDPCYLFGTRFWDQHVKVLYDTRYEKFQSFVVDGYNIYVASTKHGDGVYGVMGKDTWETKGTVNVDAGMIAMFPVSFINNHTMEKMAKDLIEEKMGCYLEMDSTPRVDVDKSTWWLGSRHFIDYDPTFCEKCKEYCHQNVQEWDDEEWGTVCGSCLDIIVEEREETESDTN